MVDGLGLVIGLIVAKHVKPGKEKGSGIAPILSQNMEEHFA